MTNSVSTNQGNNKQYFHDVAVMPSTNNQKSIVWLRNYDNNGKIQYAPLDDGFHATISEGVLIVRQRNQCNWYYDNSTNIDIEILRNALNSAKILCHHNDSNFSYNNKRIYQADTPWLLTCCLSRIPQPNLHLYDFGYFIIQ